MRRVIIWHGIFGFNTNGSQTPIKYTFPLNIVYNGWWLKIQPAIKPYEWIDAIFVVWYTGIWGKSLGKNGFSTILNITLRQVFICWSMMSNIIAKLHLLKKSEIYIYIYIYT